MNPTYDAQHSLFTLGRFKIVSGTVESKHFPYNSNSGAYEYTSYFSYPFNVIPRVLVTAEYPAGLPEVCVASVTTTYVKLSCSSQLNSLWVNWFAFSFDE